MQLIHEVRPVDARIARLLVGRSADELARLAMVSAESVRRFEAGEGCHIGTRTAILEALARDGARFEGRADVRHVDGRQGPTRAAVGVMRGERLVRARRRLGLATMEVAHRAHLTSGTLRRIELNPHDLTQAPTAGFVRLVGVLQLAGYLFAPMRGNGASADMLLVEPPSRARPAKGPSRYHTVGMRVPGLTRHPLEDPELER